MEATDQHFVEGLRANRRRSVFLAIATSLLSKGGNLLLMAVAFPLAHKVLGESRFSLFGILQAFIFTVGMSDLGLGAGMARSLTEATAKGSEEEKRKIFSTGFLVIAVLAMLSLSIVVFILTTVPMASVFGKVVTPHLAEFSTALWLCIGLFGLLFMLTPFSRWQDAVQQTYVYNRWGALGNFLSLGVLFYGIQHFPQLWWLIFALYLPQVTVLCINAGGLMKREPGSRPSIRSFDWKLAKNLLMEGLNLFVILIVAPTLVREGMRVILAHASDAETLLQFTILAQLGFYGWGFFLMLAMPLTPALTEAVTRRDLIWARGIYKKAIRLLLAALVIGPIGFALLGPPLVKVWMSNEVALDTATMAAYGLFFAFTLWSGVHGMFYAASGCLRKGAWLMGTEAVVALGCGWLGIYYRGIFGGFLAAGLCCLFVTGWMHVRLIHQQFRSLALN